MFDISAILQCLSAHLDKKNLRRLGLIVSVMLAMTGRMTMLGISRWTERRELPDHPAFFQQQALVVRAALALAA